MAVIEIAHSALVSRRGLGAIDGLLPDAVPTLFRAACRLKEASTTGSGNKPLQGRNLALLHPTAPRQEKSELRRAAQDLGARVSLVHIGEPPVPSGTDFRSLPQLLGRLYDALDCSTLPSDLVHEIARHAGVPVYDGLDREDHPVRMLASLMTMHEHGCNPGPSTSIAYRGDIGSPQGICLSQAAARLGFGIRAVEPMAKPANDAGFWIDAAAGMPWRLHAPSGRIADGDCAVNHRFVLQAVLVCTMAAR